MNTDTLCDIIVAIVFICPTLLVWLATKDEK